MTAWWQGAVVYQIYPRSFRDTDGDGIGDLPGVIERLDYVAALGVDAIWLSPVHPSPNRDFGYDVSDYFDIAAQMGGMRAFERLIAEAHKRKLKVILDEVLSHTSDRHPWFLESASSRDSARASWYVWADPKPDGTPPNNWLSAFGGPAWSYWPARRQYYFHKFLKQQPKLNFHNPVVLDAALGVLRFWLERGVDGFRLDVANSYLHDAQLRDNPPVPLAQRSEMEWGHASFQQRHIHDANLPENARVLDAIREAVSAGKDAFVFGEFSEEPSLLHAFAGADHGLHSGYTFDFLLDTSFKPEVFAKQYEFLQSKPGLFPCVTFSNHDVSRTVTRYGGGERDDALAKLALTLLLCLRGTVLLYQGEELGLGDAPIAREDVRDPVGELYFPLAKGRDPCRTPMPWDNSQGAGFSSAKPWLPIAPGHRKQAVSLQECDGNSVLNFARALIAERKRHPALVQGDLVLVTATDSILAFERREARKCILCVFNLSNAPATYDLSHAKSWKRLPIFTGEIHVDGAILALGPRAAYLAAA